MRLRPQLRQLLEAIPQLQDILPRQCQDLTQHTLLLRIRVLNSILRLHIRLILRHHHQAIRGIVFIATHPIPALLPRSLFLRCRFSILGRHNHMDHL